MKKNLALILATTLGMGCSTLKTNIQDPGVWIPLAAAATLQISDLDSKISDELRDKKPIFGSVENGEYWSDTFRDYNKTAYTITAFSTDLPADEKMKLFGKQIAIIGITSEVGKRLKDLTNEERPNGFDRKANPSGHTLSAGIHKEMVKINSTYLPISQKWKKALNVSVEASTYITAYARIESGNHYPSNVLYSLSILNFTMNASEKYFIPKKEKNITLLPRLEGNDGIGLNFNFTF